MKNNRAPILPKKIHATYTAERKFEIREFTLANRMYSYQQIADAFRMPKTTVFDIINRKSSGEPAKGILTRNRRTTGSVGLGDEGSTLASLSSAGEGEARQMIQPQVPTFKASDGWVYKFFRCNRFTLRAKTSLSQRLPAGLEGRMISYLQKLQRERKNGRFPNALIGNMDETPVYFDHVPGKTIDRVGVKSCIIRSTGAEKRHIMVVLTVAVDGSMLPHMVIFKGKRRLKLIASEGVLVSVQTKAWMDEDLMTEYLEYIWQPYVEETADKLGLPYHNALLTLDSFRTHITDKITKAMEEHSTNHPLRTTERLYFKAAATRRIDQQTF